MPSLSTYLSVERHEAGAWTIVCRCGHVLGSADRNFKELALEARYPIQHLGPQVDPNHLSSSLEVREFYCPGCAVLLDVEVSHRDDPVLHDIELDLPESTESPEG